MRLHDFLVNTQQVKFPPAISRRRQKARRQRGSRSTIYLAVGHECSILIYGRSWPADLDEAFRPNLRLSRRHCTWPFPGSIGRDETRCYPTPPRAECTCFLFILRSLRRRHIHGVPTPTESRGISPAALPPYSHAAAVRDQARLSFERIQSGQLGNSFPATPPSLCRERRNFSLVRRRNSTKKSAASFRPLIELLSRRISRGESPDISHLSPSPGCEPREVRDARHAPNRDSAVCTSE